MILPDTITSIPEIQVGQSDYTWRPAMIDNSTSLSYWLNWRFLVCGIWILLALVFAALLIWRYEGRKKRRSGSSGNLIEASGCLYEDEIWGTSLKSVHPVWLLVYRICALSVLLAILIADAIVHTRGIVYYYTQWTFVLVTVYFGLASSISTYGCVRYFHEVGPERDSCSDLDSERGTYVAAAPTDDADILDEADCRKFAPAWGYALQIIFQMCAGAVTLTDSVFWLIIYPFQTPKHYPLTFLVVCMHSVNAVFLLGDTILNRLRFPFFRFAYFVLWTCVFVIFQWIVHACMSIRWPYVFLDLSSPYAPIWYLAVGLLLFPCFGLFTLIFKLKKCFASR